MSLFSGSAYHSERSESHSAIHKLTGLSMMAGITAAGLFVARPYLGRGVSMLAEALPNQGGRIGSFAAKLVGSSAGVDAAFNSLASEESRFIVTAAEHIERSAVTFTSNAQRINKFLDQVGTHHVSDDSKVAWDNVRDEMSKFLSEVGRAGRGHETEQTFLTHNTLRAFNNKAASRGVSFKFETITHQQNVFRSIIDETARGQSSKLAVANMMASEENVQNIMNFMNKGADEYARKSRTASNFLKMKQSTLTWGAIERNAHGERDVVERYLENVGMNPARDRTRVETVLGHMDSKLNALFDHKFDERESPALQTAKAKVRERLMNAESGFSLVNRKGRDLAISMPHLRKAGDAFLDRALKDIQIPLVPYRFGIPLNTFKTFLPKSKALIQNLGNLAAHSELRRAGIEGGHDTTLLAGGGHALTFSSGEGGTQVGFIGRRLNIYDMSNKHVRRLADVRNTEVGDFLTQIHHLIDHESGNSKTVNALYNNQARFLDIGYVAEGHGYFTVKPKHGNVAFNPLIEKLHGSAVDVDISRLHPTQLAEFLMGHGHEINEHNPLNLQRALNHVFDEASQAPHDISKVLGTIHDRFHVEGAAFVDLPREYFNAYGELLRTAAHKDVSGIQTAITSTIGPDQYLPLIDMTGRVPGGFGGLAHNASNPFYRVINSLAGDTSTLGLTTQTEGGVMTGIAEAALGQSGISRSMGNLQKGLLSETVHGMGIAKLRRLSGPIGLEESLSKIWEAASIGEMGQIHDLPLTQALKRFGYDDLHLGRLSTELSTAARIDGEQVISHNMARVGELGSLMLTTDELRGVSTDHNVLAKMVDHLSNNMDIIRHLGPEKQNDILMTMAHDFDLLTTLHERFKFGRPFHPQEHLINPLTQSKFLALPAADHSFDNAFGIPDYLRALTNPHQAHSSLSAISQIAMQLPNNAGREVGLGLTAQDQITLLRSSVAFAVKRVLPLYVGVEAYKNINANLHSMGAPGFDDLGANLVANTNILGANIRDGLGLTKFAQELVGTLPGLDQYFHPRSSKEYKDYLMYGNEEVRDGRGWMIGSRSSLTGGAVDYYRPNFYRRWKSHWTEADNADVSNPYHSFLPNIQSPLAPLHLLLDPHWWEKKHIDDRPYITGGNPLGRQIFDGTGFTANTGSEYGPLAIGAFGGGYAAGMTGGGQNPDGGFGPGSGGSGPGGGGGGGPLYPQGDKVRLEFHKEIPHDEIGHAGVGSTITNLIHRGREQMGIYGMLLQRMPFYPREGAAFQHQESRHAHSLNQMLWSGGYGEATGTLGEYIRRFIPDETQDLNAYNPLPNNMPSWVPHRFQQGDPYARVNGIGELMLPGDAFERSHTWITPMKVRGSAVGGSEQEIIDSWLHPMKPLDGPDAEDIVEFGSEAHLQIQRRMKDKGILVAAETSIYDRQNNISGTIDAIIKNEQGQLEVLDIKTQGAKSWGHTPEKYIDQITTYMAITGMKSGELAFVNRDNMSQTRIEHYDFDPDRWERIKARIGRAREAVSTMVDEGVISPFETYDLLSRIEVLSKVSPDSPEFREAVEFAEKAGGFGGFEKQRFQQAMDEATQLRKQYNLYPKRYGVKTETHRTKVRGVSSHGDLITDMGSIKLAGVKWDNQAFVFKDPEEVLKSFGIHVGRSVNVTLIEGQFNPELTNDTTLEGIVGSVNKQLTKSKYASRDKATRNPLGARVAFGNSLTGKIWERVVHSDNMVNNKFMRVRTALEQFERGEVFGTDKARLSDVWNSYVVPTFNSIVAKDPVSAGVMGALVAGMFFRSRTSRPVAAAIGGTVMAALAANRGIYERLSGNTWTPKRYRKQTEFDQYWDTLEYLKETAVAEQAKHMAKKQEGVDIDKLTEEKKRQFVGLGPWGALAVQAERRAKSTMFGFDVDTGSLQQAIAAIPRRHRQLAEEIITTGSMNEKQRFYDMLPDSEKRVLGKFMGADRKDLPNRPKMDEYFKQHFLPGADWMGWNKDVDMNDLETRSANLEHTKIDRPSRQKIDKALAYSRGVAVPKMDHPSYGNIQSAIRAILHNGGHNGIDVNFSIHPSPYKVVNVDMDVFHDQTDDLIDEMKRETRN